MREQLKLDFYNTNATEGVELEERKRKATSQQVIILSIFKRYNKMTAGMVHQQVMAAGLTWPLTSVRRAITNLMKEGHLRRTDYTRRGVYGANERFYELKWR
jgi:Fe2+ or Zn2+ uptake regulation protein